MKSDRGHAAQLASDRKAADRTGVRTATAWLLLGGVMLLAGDADAAAPRSGATSTSASKDVAELRAGQSAITNDLLVQCLANQVRVVPSDSSIEGATAQVPVRESRGPLQSSFADCRLDDGTSVRVKSGQQSQPMAYGQCGGAPGEKLSVWIDRRKVLSSFGYAGRCEDMMIKSLVIQRAGARVCVPPIDGQGVRPDDFADLRARGLDQDGCAALAFVRPKGLDAGEFVVDGRRPAQAGAFSLTAVPGMRAACVQLLPRRADVRPRVPATLARPAWQTLKLSLQQPELEHLGFNATTLSIGGAVDVATFDLGNTGAARRVYRLESFNHWFDGTALAVDTDGILTVPFDAHDEAGSARRGIHAWVYDHAQVFFHGGRTYLLLDPVNQEMDARVVTLHGDQEETVCTLHRAADRF